MPSKSIVAATLAVAGQTAYASTVHPNRETTAPMGFNNWQRFECNLNETLFVKTADAMASNGMLAAGYNRINLDDCWMQTSRAANGTLQWDTTKFPQGLIWLGQYLKSKGFKFGIYEDAGTYTCGGYPGSQGYEMTDAATFASWGIDYVKVDGCNADPGTLEQYQANYAAWKNACDAQNPPLILSNSEPAYFENTQPWYTVMGDAPYISELARHSADVQLYSGGSGFWNSILFNYYEQNRLARYQKAGYVNDPDFIIADSNFTIDEKRSQFALWASLGAPLIVSSYIPDLTSDELAYILNKDIIAVDQDALGLQATLVSQDGTWDILTRNLANGDRLLTVLNRGDSAGTTTVTFDKVGIPAGTYTIKDLWTGKSKKVSSVSISLASHATAIYRISGGAKSVTPTGQIFNANTQYGYYYGDNCMTAATDGSNTVTWSTCAGTNSQIWTVSSKGAVSPLSNTKLCLTGSSSAGTVTLTRCASGAKGQSWNYTLKGNLQESRSGKCLNGGGPNDGSASSLATCSDDSWDSQIFGLPGGTTIVYPTTHA